MSSHLGDQYPVQQLALEHPTHIIPAFGGSETYKVVLGHSLKRYPSLRSPSVVVTSHRIRNDVTGQEYTLHCPLPTAGDNE